MPVWNLGFLAGFGISGAEAEANEARTDLVLCDVFPIWHPPGECPGSFKCPTPKEAP